MVDRGRSSRSGGKVELPWTVDSGSCYVCMYVCMYVSK